MPVPSRSTLLAAFWATAGAVLVLALLPASTPLPTTGWDKLNHALAFGILAALGLACWPTARLRVLLLLLTYGGAIELAQSVVGYRRGEWLDMAADGLGVLLVYGLTVSRRARRS